MPLLGGVRPPIAALLAVLIAVAGVTALVLRDQEQRKVDAAVLSTQQRVAEDGALSLRASLDESVVDLQRAARTFNGIGADADDEILDRLDEVYDKWRGKAVIEPSSGKLLAASGETIPLADVRDRRTAAGAIRPKLIKLASGEARMLVFAPLDAGDGSGQRLLVASGTLTVPSIATGDERALSVLDSSGAVLAADGPRAGRAFLADDAKRLAAAAAGKGTPGQEVTSGSTSGERRDGERLAAGYAAVSVPQDRDEPSPAAALGLTVVTTVAVEQAPVTLDTQLFGLVSAASLLLITLLVSALLYATLQRPLLLLYRESGRLTRGDLRRPVPALRYGEAARTAAALESLRLQLQGAPEHALPPAARRRAGATLVVVLCGVLILLWSVPLLFLVNRADTAVSVPRRLVVDQRLRTDTTADRVRKALNEGYADLASTAQTADARLKEGNAEKLLDMTLEEHDRYRSLYLLEEGDVLARAGEEPRHPPAASPEPGTIVQLNSSGKEPLVAGYAAIPGREDAVVVGEFAPQFLVTLVTRPGLGRIHLVDEERRIVAADGRKGFRAFSPLPGAGLNELAGDAAEAHRPKARLLRGDGTVIAAAAPFTGGGAAKGLDWQVVSAQPAAWTTLPEYVVQRRTMLAGLLGVAAATACLGWLHIVVVRPLRALAARAEALAGGDRRTVLFPQHHDEVGAVVRNLELLRQQAVGEPRAARAPRARSLVTGGRD